MSIPARTPPGEGRRNPTGRSITGLVAGFALTTLLTLVLSHSRHAINLTGGA